MITVVGRHIARTTRARRSGSSDRYIHYDTVIDDGGVSVLFETLTSGGFIADEFRLTNTE